MTHSTTVLDLLASLMAPSTPHRASQCRSLVSGSFRSDDCVPARVLPAGLCSPPPVHRATGRDWPVRALRQPPLPVPARGRTARFPTPRRDIGHRERGSVLQDAACVAPMTARWLGWPAAMSCALTRRLWRRQWRWPGSLPRVGSQATLTPAALSAIRRRGLVTGRQVFRVPGRAAGPGCPRVILPTLLP